MNELLKKALVGEVILNYFTSGRHIRVLYADVYAENRQGAVIAFDGYSCWKIVYSIKLDFSNDKYEFEVIKRLSGIMAVPEEKED